VSRYDNPTGRNRPPEPEFLNLQRAQDSIQRNKFLAGRYYDPIPNRFLAPIECLKIPAQASKIHSMESIPGLLKRFTNSSSVLEFLNNLWGLGTEQE
jgi:hypothetical protein